MVDIKYASQELGINEIKYYDTIYFTDMPKPKFTGKELLDKLSLSFKNVDQELFNLYDEMLKKGYIDCKIDDSSKKLKFKKRKNKNQYDYRENFGINRIGRTFKDFIKYKIKNNVSSYVQMDFLGSRKDSDQQILTLHFLPLEFIYIAVFDKKCTVDDVVNLFNDLEKKLGFEDFNRIFHTVLTDRDILFNKYESFEQSSLEKSKKRMNIFYCNPASSSQKANVENSNNQLRRIFLKDDLIQDVTSSMISEINSNLNSR